MVRRITWEWSGCRGRRETPATKPRRRRQLMVTGGDPAMCSILALVVAVVVRLMCGLLPASSFSKPYNILNLSFGKIATLQTKYF